MYSSANNPDHTTSILSIKEIIGLVFVFSFVLYLIFPKKNIDKLIEGDSTNRNLSINYLESMLLYYPDSIKIKNMLIQNYITTGKLDKALALNREMLSTVKEREELKKLYKSEYLLLKKLYFKKGDKSLLKEVKERLYNYFEFTKEKRDYTFFFAEATQLDFTKLKYISLKGFLKERADLVNYEFEKDAFIQSLALGYKKESYRFLLSLIEFPEFEEKLYSYALNRLIEERDYLKAKDLATRFFLNSKDKKKRLDYFNTALYLTIKSSKNINIDIMELISLYQNSMELKSNDILFLLKKLLGIDIKTASNFAWSSFENHKDIFDSNLTKKTIESLVYDKQLSKALELAKYAKEKFKTTQWLDKTIQLSLWQGKMEDVVSLNIEGYRRYKNPKYEEYILKSCNLNSAYEVLGDIYRKKVESGDYSNIKKLAEYFEYTGDIDRAESYFLSLYKKHPIKSVAKEVILFNYKNSHYRRGVSLYKQYKSRYGIDKELQELTVQKLISLKRFKEAYAYAKVLKENRRLFDLGWLQKDYRYIYNKLWRLEQEGNLATGNYGKLIQLESSLNGGKKLVYLYKKIWKKTKKRAYLTALLYKYLDNNDLKGISKLLHTITPKDRDYLDKKVEYHILMANYYIKQDNRVSAMKEYNKALSIDNRDPSTHQAYLWFLLDNELIKPLKKEFSLLQKSKKLQKEIGFATVILALKFQHSDLALRWLKPLLKSSDNIEYKVVYADLLELQDRARGASKIRLKLFKRLSKMLKKEPKLLKDKEFARVYLGLILRYKTPYSKRAKYFKEFKKLFSKKEFQEIEIGKYTQTGSSSMVRYLANRYKMNLPWLNLYLAINLNNNQKKEKLLKKYIDTLPFRDRVMASLDIGDRAGAYSLAFSGMNDNSRDVELFKIYNNMVNEEYPRGSFSTDYKHLTPKLTAKHTTLSYGWNIYKGLKSKISIDSYDYNSRASSSLSFALKNSDKKFLWDFSLTKHNSRDDFTSSSLDFKYRFNDLELGTRYSYQDKTTQTPQLQRDGLETYFDLSIKKIVNQHTQLSLNYKNSKYKKESGNSIGKSEQFQLSSDFRIRKGYPDIKFNSYINYNRYDEVIENILPKDFAEVGTQLSIGTSSKESIHNSWRPFGTFGLALNNHHDLGTAISMGVSGSLKGADNLSLSLDYSKGVDALTKPYYGFRLGYQF